MQKAAKQETPEGKNLRRSGTMWVREFPQHANVKDLRSPFRERVEAFIDALERGKARVTISATLRDQRRAYLMHWSWKIYKGLVEPDGIPSHPQVAIEWAHTDSKGEYAPELSKQAAKEMALAFGLRNLGTAPSLNSRHVHASGIDMNISWTGDLHICDGHGHAFVIKTLPRNGTNPQLRMIGESYGVYKYRGKGRDDPHWSDTGA
jgi:hypothetical protein